MKKSDRKTQARWLAGVILVLALTLLGSQSIYPQDFAQGHPLGDIPLEPVTYQKHLKFSDEAMALDALPLAYDARTQGIVTSAKNQGSCGSCWAFASVGAMESHLLKQFSFGPTDLSEQQQVSCNTSMLGCSGGNSSAIRYWETRGPLWESCFPYTASGTTPCAEDLCTQLGYRVIDWHTVPTNVDGFKNSLYTYGPSYWRYDVYTDFDTYWNSGSPDEVYVNKAGSTYRGGHAVLLIGWDDSKGAYLCKNSWGTNGGPNGDGTFWIAYTGHYNNLGFGMSNFSLTAITCSSPADCDDGLFCNGTETCVDNVCHDGIPPNCSDDGLFCNGSETCDEVNDQCGSTGNPCAEETACNEEQDRCILVTCNNGVCDPGENCSNCPNDCPSGQGGSCGDCFKGVCDGQCHPVKEGPNCADCAPSWCCGDSVCEGGETSDNCAVDCPPAVCDDGTCDPGETPCSCPGDCGLPPSNENGLCANSADDDCDGATDCADSDCSLDPKCTCLPKGSTCSVNSDCCSNKCRAAVCR